jgi:hypothetical protein
MTLEIKIPSELEQQLHQAADQAGVSADVYILRLLEQNLPTHLSDNSGKRLLHTEAQLLQRINQSLSAIDWQRYQQLLTQRDAVALSDSEHTELIALSDQIEEMNVNRIQALTELAKIRHTTVRTLITELGLTPIVYD